MNIFSMAITHDGNVRDNNEDNFYINGVYKQETNAARLSHLDTSERDSHVFSVCDGMGGESLGELASLRAIELLKQTPAEKLYESPEDYMQRANRLICDEIEKNNRKRIGTTASVLMIKDETCRICHIGDSRIYRLREGKLVQLTKDHTRVQQMIDAGIIKKEDAGKSRQKHVLTQHLGIFPSEFLIEPQMIIDEDVRNGDLFLLCSDGLTDMLTDEQIGAQLVSSENVSDIATALIQSALDQGGKDNITVVVVKTV